MIPKKIKNTTYRFQFRHERVEFTPLSQLFTEEQLAKILDLDLVQHQCHFNAAKVASLFDCEYCEGMFAGAFDHAFNSIEKDGQRFYFDATEFINNAGDADVVPSFDTVVFRAYSAKEIMDVFGDFETAFVTTGIAYTHKFGSFTIDDDGKVVELKTA